MKLLIALAALFTFLVVCSWYTTPGGYLGAGDMFTTGISQAQDGEYQQQDVATSEAESLNLFPNERIQTNCNGQSVLDSQVSHNTCFLPRYGENIWLNANRYRPGSLTKQSENTDLTNIVRRPGQESRLII